MRILSPFKGSRPKKLTFLADMSAKVGEGTKTLRRNAWNLKK